MPRTLFPTMVLLVMAGEESLQAMPPPLIAVLPVMRQFMIAAEDPSLQ